MLALSRRQCHFTDWILLFASVPLRVVFDCQLIAFFNFRIFLLEIWLITIIKDIIQLKSSDGISILHLFLRCFMPCEKMLVYFSLSDCLLLRKI